MMAGSDCQKRDSTNVVCDQGEEISEIIGSCDSSPSKTTSIEVMTTSNEGGRRTWDKPQYCKFCLTPQKKLPCHFILIHGEGEKKIEVEVVQWQATKDKDEKYES